jgi:hypothetical protein
LPHASRDRFEVLGRFFAQDGTYYYIGQQQFLIGDEENWYCSFFTADPAHRYVGWKGCVPRPLDFDSLQLLFRGKKPHLYFRDASGVYFCDGIRECQKIPFLSSDSMELLGEGGRLQYFRVGSRVYVYAPHLETSEFYLQEISDLSQDRFRLLDDFFTEYATDEARVFFYGGIVEGADVETFQILPWGYARDKNHVYKDGVVLDGVHPNTFQFPSLLF